ncbi:VIR protein [Plasmodium vivax]|uniref:VIR protein n=1 Tax=Plasmodium vivax TaxID=5855 RepID=A0A1G4GS92_PLAVI|nr:VIR protein [Plasmodium vivax]
MIADTTLFVKDLPSKKFYNKVKDAILYEDILKYIRSNDIKNVEIWIDKFRERLLNYLMNETAEWKSIKPEKRCSDLNFIIDVIVERIEKSKLRDNIYHAHNVLKTSTELINHHSPTNCARSFNTNIKDGVIFKRYFDNLCEDSSFIISNIEQIKKGGKCKAIVKCSTNMAKIFEGKFCAILPGELDSEKSQNVKGSSEHPEGTLVAEQVKEELEDSAAGEVTDKDMSPPLHSFDLELGNDEKPLDLNTTYAASTLLGTSLMAIILYKFKPFNSRIPSKNLRRAQIIPAVHDGEATGWLLNNFDYQEMNSDHHEYHMPYGAVNNL